MRDGPRTADTTPDTRARAALAELDDALRRFHRAYEDWLSAGRADVAMRRALLTDAETRLQQAREALDTLEAALVDARQASTDK